MRWFASVLVLFACSKPPPPKPPVVEKPVSSLADVAGKWVTFDDMDWGYTMTIEPSGVIDVWIDRGKIGRCEQKGKIGWGGKPGLLRVVYLKGECNPQAVGIAFDMTVSSFTGDSLTIVVADQSRTYQRAPETPTGGEKAPPVQLR